MLNRSLTILAAALAIGLTGCGKMPATSSALPTAGTGAQAMVSTAARDKMATTLINEYKGLSWSYDAEKKKTLLSAIVGTGSDLAVDLLLTEYQGLSWSYDAEKKKMFLELMKQLTASVDTNPPKQSLTKTRAPQAKGPSHQALTKVANSLTKDLDEAPSDAKKTMKEIINKVLIISPNTGR